MSSIARYDELMRILSRKDRVLCLIRPDPDSMASALALRCLLIRKVSRVEIAYDEAIHRLENRAMVRLLKIPLRHVQEINFREFSRLAVVDGQPGHFPQYALRRFDLIFDHHPLKEKRAYAFSDIRPGLGATSTIMEEYLRAGRLRINQRLATALCYGIKSDTDNFQRDVTRADAEAFSRLFPMADYDLLQLIEQVEIPLRELHYFRDTLDRLKVSRRMAVIHLGFSETYDVAVIIADFLIRVSGIEFVAISCMTPDKLIIIFRSRNPGKQAGEIAGRAFGDIGSAGGHDSSARAEISRSNLEEPLHSGQAELIENFILKRIREKKSLRSRRKKSRKGRSR
jgi:nanoRNase/pAp phosphatase (c-di-AMP/oligoRNAs hydrolase)